jgi:hypothetical protein
MDHDFESNENHPKSKKSKKSGGFQSMGKTLNFTLFNWKNSFKNKTCSRYNNEIELLIKKNRLFVANFKKHNQQRLQASNADTTQGFYNHIYLV